MAYLVSFACSSLERSWPLGFHLCLTFVAGGYHVCFDRVQLLDTLRRERRLPSMIPRELPCKLHSVSYWCVISWSLCSWLLMLPRGCLCICGTPLLLAPPCCLSCSHEDWRLLSALGCSLLTLGSPWFQDLPHKVQYPIPLQNAAALELIALEKKITVVKQ